MKNLIKRKCKEESYIKRGILFADFETVIVDSLHYVSVYDIYDGHRHVCKSLYDVSHGNIKSKSRELISSFIEDCFDCASNSIIYFHNFGRFDSLFILRNIDISKYNVNIKMRDNVYYEVVVFYEKKRVIFRDSYLLFPSSLNDMAQLFMNDKKKDFIHNYEVCDYLNVDKVKNIEEYCKYDVYLLYMSFNKYREYVYNMFHIDICRSLTLSSLSLKIFLTHYYDENLTPITHSEGNVDSFIRRAYKGGIVDVYKPILENGYCYDVNSLYPYVMSKYKMPSTFIEYVKDLNGSTDFDINSFFGFVEVDVFCDKINIPFLTYSKKDVGLISPIGQWRSVYFSEEIKYALSLGYRFKYYSYVSFKSDDLFRGFVSTLYDIRVKNKNTPLDKIIKFILNSLYGRFGMVNDIRKCLLLNSDKYEKYINDLLVLYDVKFCEVIDSNKIFIKYANRPILDNAQYVSDVSLLDKAFNLYENDSRNLNTAVHIAAAITAYARIEMYKYKIKYNVYYSDTDSIFTDCEIDCNEIGNHLGQMKLEYTIKKGIFISPKLYCIEKHDNSYLMKGKGVDTKVLTKDHYLQMYSGLSISFNVTRNFSGDLVHFFIRSLTTEITLTGAFTKREKIYDKHGNWIDTYPYYINENYDGEF